MLRPAVVALAFALLVLPSARAVDVARGQVTGRWIGAYTLGSSPTYLKVSFFGGGRRLAGDATNARGVASPLTGVSVRRNRVGFRLGRLRFTGAVRGGSLSGSVRRGSARGRFRFIRIATPSRSALAGRVGVYGLDAGRRVAVFESGREHGVGFGGAAGAGGLRLVDLGSGDARGLFPRPDGAFAIGPALNVGYPVVEQISLRAAVRLPIARENVTFPSERATIAGWLWRPAGPGRHPAVVIVHGSGPAVRSQDYLQHVVHLFAPHGLAVLIYDKRGSGRSTGVYPGDSPSEPTFRTLSDDVLAGVRYLRSRADIDPARVGLWGLSQGGWVG